MPIATPGAELALRHYVNPVRHKFWTSLTLNAERHLRRKNRCGSPLLNLEWDERLGRGRVYLDLAKEWRAAGHSGGTLLSFRCISDLVATSAAGFALRQVWFAAKAANPLSRKNAARFDIIDALIGSLAGFEKRLEFKGLLVARSVGLHHSDERFEKSVQERWPAFFARQFPRAESFIRSTRKWLLRASDKTVSCADLINVPNPTRRIICAREICHSTAGDGSAVWAHSDGRHALSARRAATAQPDSAKIR